MIRYADGGDYAATVRSLSGGDPYACRILSLWQCYPPPLPFVDYWLTTDDSGKATGAIARNGADFVLLLTDKTDAAEVASFLQMAGAKRALCDGGFSLPLPGRITQGAVMKTAAPVHAAAVGAVAEPPLRAVYALMTACAGEHFTPPLWEDFYLDLNHRLRHGAALLRGVYDGEKLAAAAMTVAQDAHDAVLGAVCCRPDRRGRGFGSLAVAAAVNPLIAAGKTVWLHRAQTENAAFYAALGFAEACTWTEYHINEESDSELF